MFAFHNLKVKMILFIIFLFLVPFMAAFYFGYTGHTLITPIVIATMMAFFNVRDGWREGGAAKSMLLGTVFSAIVIIPVYYAGSGSEDFNEEASYYPPAAAYYPCPTSASALG